MMHIRTILFTSLLFLITSSALRATEHAQLRAQISGIHRNNTWFLCLPHENGCFRLQTTAKGKTFPIEPGHINKLFVLNTQNNTLNATTLPKSCNVTLQPRQTLEIKGSLRSNQNGYARIEHVSCQLTG